MLRYNLSMNLCADYSNMVKAWMQGNGIRSDKTGWELWYDYFNLQKKTIKARKRNVLFSKEFVCPPQVQAGLNLLVNKFKNGENVIPHLSKKALNPLMFDELLYDWGIYHFHLGIVTSNTGHIERTGPVLFARIDDNNVYCINIYLHGKNVLPPWYRQDMIRIIHRNWPEIIKCWRISDAVSANPKLTDQEYKQIRQNHLNTLIEVEKGVVYFSPGQGMTSSGHSSELVFLCDRIWNTLKMNELYIKEHIPTFISAIQSNIGILPDGKKLYFKLWHEDKNFYIVDTGSQTALLKIDLP